MDAVDLRRGLGSRPQVELLRRPLVVRRDPGIGEHRGAGLELAPVRDLLRRRSESTGPERLGQPPVPRQDRLQALNQRVDGVEPGVAEHPGVEVARSCPDSQVEGDQAARGDSELRLVPLGHAAVEDEARIRRPAVLADPVADGRPADLLLAVERDADVDRQLALGGQPSDSGKHDVELALVVCDATAVEPAVPLHEGKGIGLPQVERRRRLDVEVVVTEDSRRRICVLRGPHLTDHERLACGLDERRLASGGHDHVPHPLGRPAHVVRVLRIRADAGDRDQLG